MTCYLFPIKEFLLHKFITSACIEDEQDQRRDSCYLDVIMKMIMKTMLMMMLLMLLMMMLLMLLMLLMMMVTFTM